MAAAAATSAAVAVDIFLFRHAFYFLLYVRFFLSFRPFVVPANSSRSNEITNYITHFDSSILVFVLTLVILFILSSSNVHLSLQVHVRLSVLFEVSLIIVHFHLVSFFFLFILFLFHIPLVLSELMLFSCFNENHRFVVFLFSPVIYSSRWVFFCTGQTHTQTHFFDFRFLSVSFCCYIVTSSKNVDTSSSGTIESHTRASIH